MTLTSLSLCVATGQIQVEYSVLYIETCNFELLFIIKCRYIYNSSLSLLKSMRFCVLGKAGDHLGEKNH